MSVPIIEKESRKISAIIIDDEPGCVSYLVHCLSKYCPKIHIAATGNKATDIYNFIKTVHFDIAFLDIKVFNENIFDVIKKIGRINFEIIFVTAYDSYAVKAIKAEALDYILKPLLKDEIIECYKKIKRRFFEKKEASSIVEQAAKYDLKKIFVKQGERVFIVKQSDIIYLKAKGAYTEIVFNNNNNISVAVLSKPIGTLEDEYSQDLFYRVHKSYLINIKKVLKIEKHDTLNIKMENNELVPVAQRRAQEFLSFIQNTDEA